MGGPCNMNIGDTTDLGGRGNFGTLVTTLGPRPCESWLNKYPLLYQGKEKSTFECLSQVN